MESNSKTGQIRNLVTKKWVIPLILSISFMAIPGLIGATVTNAGFGSAGFKEPLTHDSPFVLLSAVFHNSLSSIELSSKSTSVRGRTMDESFIPGGQENVIILVDIYSAFDENAFYTPKYNIQGDNKEPLAGPASSAPEPQSAATMFLLGVSLVTLAGFMRRKIRR